MSAIRLKGFRVAVSSAILVVLALALAGVPGLSAVGGWLAAVQLVPSVLALTGGAFLSLAGVVILIATLLVGRVYCSFLCPLGALQDVIARVEAYLNKRQRKLPYAPAVPHIRLAVVLVAVVGMVAGWSGLVLSVLDPYSNFGRIVSELLRPLVKPILRLLPGAAQLPVASSAFHWSAVGALILPVVALGVVGVLAALRGRLYCNTVCPVGTVLGFVSSHAALRIQIDEGCKKCQKCVRVCKSQCIDAKTGTVDASRCVSCFNCIPVCSGSYIGLRPQWGKKELSATPPQEPLTVASTKVAAVPNSARRAVVTGGVLALVGAMGSELLWAGEGKVAEGDKVGAAKDVKASAVITAQNRAVRPPGTVNLERFLDRCTSCQLCISACPTQVLHASFLREGLSGLLKPEMNYAASYCSYDCHRCGEVCPSGALSALSLEAKRSTRIGLARFEASRCVVETKQTDCTRCIDHCPTKALKSVAYGDKLHLPQVDALRCIGCGRCEHECPVQGQKAITVFGLLRETHLPPAISKEISGARA